MISWSGMGYMYENYGEYRICSMDNAGISYKFV